MIAVLLVLFLTSPQSLRFADAEARNLLRNPDASQGSRLWNAFGNATVEDVSSESCFVLRGGGGFTQVVSISEGNEDLYVVMLGRVMSEYVHPNAIITDRPYLYGLALGEAGRILGYLQGQTMRGRGPSPHRWETAYGVFHVPKGTIRIQFELGQALRNGVPYTGAGALFDDLALYVATSESSARGIVASRVTESPIEVGLVTLPVPVRRR
jgi:hypothetical protein